MTAPTVEGAIQASGKTSKRTRSPTSESPPAMRAASRAATGRDQRWGGSAPEAMSRLSALRRRRRASRTSSSG